jgi:hypothetical protein
LPIIVTLVATHDPQHAFRIDIAEDRGTAVLPERQGLRNSPTSQMQAPNPIDEVEELEKD